MWLIYVRDDCERLALKQVCEFLWTAYRAVQKLEENYESQA